MRAIVPLFLIGCSVTLLCASCAAPRATSPHFSPPSAAPVRKPITDAQSHAAIAKSRVAHASRVLVEASRLDPGKKNLSAGTPKGTFETNALPIADLNVATQEIDALTAELLTAQTALNSLEKQTSDQTDSLNRANDDKNAALLDRDREKRLANKIAGQRNKLFLLLSAAVIWIFRTPLMALVKMIAALVTKLPI